MARLRIYNFNVVTHYVRLGDNVDLRAQARSLLFFVVDSVCPSVRPSVHLSVCHAALSNLFFFFVSLRNRAIFLAVSSPCATLQNCIFFDFWFRPPNAQHLLPKICNCTKSPISRLVWHIDRRRLGLLGGFSGMADSMEAYKLSWAEPCCHGNEIWAKIAYNSASMADRPQMFGPTRGFSWMADSMEPCKMLWGRPLLPWQRNFS